MKLRIYTSLILIFVCQIAFGQTYSSLITDKEIYNFLNWLTKNEKKFDEEPFFKRKQIHYQITKWDTANFISNDTTKNSKELDRKYLFKTRLGLDTIFNQAERIYLYQQYLAIKDTIWQEGFKKPKLTNKISKKRPNIYFYSLPLFSRDKKYAMVHIIYYCGTLCAHFGYFIYRKIDNNKWEFVDCRYCGIS